MCALLLARARAARAVLLSMSVPLLLVSLAACTPTIPKNPPVTSTPTSARVAFLYQRALAWSQVVHGNPQVFAIINGAPARQITRYTALGEGCGPVGFGVPMFSPDLTHVLFADGFGCEQALTGTVYTAAVSSGSLAEPQAVPLPQGTGVRTTLRTYGWIDDATIFVVANGAVYTYALGAASLTPLPGLQNVVEALLRGSTLYCLVSPPPVNNVYTASLMMYNLSKQTPIPTNGLTQLGSFVVAAADVEFRYQGWDVSLDGTRLVIQATTPSASGGIASSIIYSAKADATQPIQIAYQLHEQTLVRIGFNSDGSRVAITDSGPGASLATAGIYTFGAVGDPTFVAHTPGGAAYPAWDGAGTLYVASNEITDSSAGGPAVTHGIYRYGAGTTAGTLFRAGGFSPWTTYSQVPLLLPTPEPTRANPSQPEPTRANPSQSEPSSDEAAGQS